MMKVLKCSFILAVMILLAGLNLLIACGDDEEEILTESGTPSTTSTVGGTEEPADKVEITIGVVSDKTGIAASTWQIFDMALDDLVEYYNQEKLIPGVELKTEFYDGQNDPSKDIPGYEWLTNRGADLIFTANDATALNLKPRVDKDKTVLFTVISQHAVVDEPGYVFVMSTPYEETMTAFLDWIAENDPDFPEDRPAKIAMVQWNLAMDVSLAKVMKDHCDAHPDRYAWQEAYLTPVPTFIYGPEVEATKDCDYVFPPTVGLVNFAREYRRAGGSAKFFGGDGLVAFLRSIDDAKAWGQIDGLLLAKVNKYWNEEDPMVDLTKKLLFENHPGEAEEIMRGGVGYLIMVTYMQILEMIADAVETVGPENFSSEALYEAVQQYSLEVDGVEDYITFGPEKRVSNNYFAVYRIDAATEDVVRLEPGVWHRIIGTP